MSAKHVTVQVAERARELVERMTLEERLAMMDGDLPLYAGLLQLLRHDYYHRKPFPSGRNDRLGIAGIQFIDGPRGVVLKGGATTFPVSMARGATFDPSLEERVGDAIAKELRSHGGNLYGGVCVNLLRHPAWGRAQETYGEDPVHVGALGAALVRGVERHAMACVKHLAANSMENARFQVDIQLAPRVLHEVYLPHFKACIDAGASAVMSAYNAVNGDWCGESKALLTDILRDRWGFDGFVISDFVFGVRDAVKGANAGLDVEMPFRFVYRDGLRHAVRSGLVSEDRVREAATRVLRKLLALPPASDYPRSLRVCEAHRQLAREVATRSMVLLTNDDALPIGDGQTVALIGRLADVPNLGDRGSSDGRPPYVVTPRDGLEQALGDRLRYDDGSDHARAAMLAKSNDVALVVVGYTHREEGEYVAPGSMAAFAKLFPPPPPLDRLLARGVGRRVWSKLMDGAARAGMSLARKHLASDRGSFGLGGDRASLRLRRQDVALIKAVAEANPNTVVAIMAGSAVLIDDWADDVAAVVLTWYPGMEGGHALADLLVGKANFSGRLPFTVAAREADYPDFDRDATRFTYDLWHGYQKLDRDGRAPAYPYGFGLSYTRFELAALQVEPPTRQSTKDQAIRLGYDVTNTGTHAGIDTQLVFAGARGAAVERAEWQLVGFSQCQLAPGERRRVEIAVPRERLAYFDEDRDDFVVAPGRYQVMVCRHHRDPDALVAQLTLAADA